MRTVFTERFGLDHPVIQGPFGGGLSMALLTSARHRAALFSREAEHTLLTRTFTGRLSRGLKHRSARALMTDLTNV